MRALVSVVAALSVLALAAGARAQEDEGEGQRVTTTAVYIIEGELPAAAISTVNAGIRRGLKNVGGVRYVHPADVLLGDEERAAPEAVQAAIDELAAGGLADQIRTGDAEDAGRRVSAAIEIFEDNLVHVKRAALVDAYMLQALAWCRQNSERRCVQGFEYVLTFRESAEYDTTRYPPEYQELFEETRTRVLASERGALRVETVPEGAEVFIDGRSYGPSPVIADELLVGEHYISIKLIGYRRLSARARVEDGGRTTVSYELQRSEEARLLEDNLEHIRGELGQERAGRYIHGMLAYLFVNQVIIGVVRPSGSSAVTLELFLYDLRTRFLLARQRGTVAAADGVNQAAQLAATLYRGVDLTGSVAPPEEQTTRVTSTALYERWWFWTVIGVVVVSGVVAFSVSSGGEDIPEGVTRVTGQFR